MYGTSQAFGIALWMMAGATVITLIGLDIRHQDLTTDATPGEAVAAASDDAGVVVPPPRTPLPDATSAEAAREGRPRPPD